MDNNERKLDKAVSDVKDTVDEAKHRTIAEGEKAKREIAGDEMTMGEHLESGINEAKNRVEADVDRAKRKVRDST